MWLKLWSYIDQMLEGFRLDPADSDYQRGYHAAVMDIQILMDEIEASSNED